MPRRRGYGFASRRRTHDSSGAAAPAASVLDAGGSSSARLGGRRRVVSGAGWRERLRVAGAGPRFRAARNAHRLCLQAAARARDVSGGGGGAALHRGASVRPHLRRVHPAVRASSRAGYTSHARKPGQELRQPRSMLPVTLMWAGRARPGLPRPPPHDLERTRGGGGRGGRGSDPTATVSFLPAMPSPDPSSCRGSQTTR